MACYNLEETATDGNFDEVSYLLANPDVADAVKYGTMQSGRIHFEIFGKNEGRKIRFSPSIITETKKKKLNKIKPLLRTDMTYLDTNDYYDFLTEELRLQFNIVDTNAVSSNGYDTYAMELIKNNEEGLVLDCGAGRRPVYEAIP